MSWRRVAGAQKQSDQTARAKRAARPQRTVAAALLGCAGALLFTLQDAAFKWYSAHYAILQIIFLRSLLALGVSALWMWRQGGAPSLRLARPKLFLASLAANITAWVCFYTGLAQLPLTVAICVFFLTPVVTAAGAVFFLREALSWRQVVALLCGFAGVLIITHPFAATADIPLPAVGFILISVLMWSSMAIITRALVADMTLGTTLFYNNLAFLLFSLFALLFMAAAWTPPAAAHLAGMLALGVLGALAQACVFSAYRSANTSVAATAEYTALLWAALLGYWLWEEQLTPRALTGAALIIAAGLLVMHRKKN